MGCWRTIQRDALGTPGKNRKRSIYLLPPRGLPHLQYVLEFSNTEAQECLTRVYLSGVVRGAPYPTRDWVVNGPVGANAPCRDAILTDRGNYGPFINT